MTGISHSVQFVCLSFIAALTSAQLASGQTTTQGHALTLATSKDSVVRFFYQPPGGEYFHVALLFRVVKKSDSLWNSAPVVDEGRTAYISLSEMQQLMSKLTRLPLHWSASAQREALETYANIHSYRGMGIKVLSANGTAKATIAPDEICKTLGALDGALQTRRALWEFQFFRLQYHCQVTNFNFNAYRDRIP